MRNIKDLLLLSLVLIGISSGCDNNEQEKSSLYCDFPTGDLVKGQLGRIYKWSDSSSGNFFYYIGNPDVSLRAGGFVPCNDLSETLKPAGEIGLEVVYTGFVKLGRDAEEPIYFGIEITELRRRK